jgi:hypothetical protein
MAKVKWSEWSLQAVARSREQYEIAIASNWRYPYFFDFLQCSPSYRLAHWVETGKIDPLSHPLPADFDEVRRTYAAFGSVYRTNFWLWWLKKAQFQFGVSAKPQPKALVKLGYRDEFNPEKLADIQSGLEQLLTVDRPAQGDQATLILALPIYGDRNDILKSVGQLIDNVFGANYQQVKISAYQLLSNKIRESTLKMAKDVLYRRIERPSERLFVIGNRANVSPHHWSDETIKRSKGEENKRRNMEVLTSRHLYRAYLLAEHAARGRFPCMDPLPEDPNRPLFNYKALNSQFRGHIKWFESLIKEMEKERNEKGYVRNSIKPYIM